MPSRSTILIHGWRSAYDQVLMDALAADLDARRWSVHKLDYSRLGNGGGCPTTLDDVLTAIDAVRGDADAYGAADRIRPCERTVELTTRGDRFIEETLAEHL